MDYYINSFQKMNERPQQLNVETMKDTTDKQRGDQHRYEYGFIGCNLPLNINRD